ncbi:hypothetical protein [Treponema sp. R80B11-R83G3]
MIEENHTNSSHEKRMDASYYEVKRLISAIKAMLMFIPYNELRNTLHKYFFLRNARNCHYMKDLQKLTTRNKFYQRNSNIDITLSRLSKLYYFLKRYKNKTNDAYPFTEKEKNDTKYSLETDDIAVNIGNVFEELYTQWRAQTKFDSFIGNSTDSNHEKIIQLGNDAVPFIINKLRTENAHLFIALNKITGKNPVKKENRGNVRKMAKDWIHWDDNINVLHSD